MRHLARLTPRNGVRDTCRTMTTENERIGLYLPPTVSAALRARASELSASTGVEFSHTKVALVLLCRSVGYQANGKPLAAAASSPVTDVAPPVAALSSPVIEASPVTAPKRTAVRSAVRSAEKSSTTSTPKRAAVKAKSTSAETPADPRDAGRRYLSSEDAAAQSTPEALAGLCGKLRSLGCDDDTVRALFAERPALASVTAPELDAALVAAPPVPASPRPEKKRTAKKGATPKRAKKST